MTDTKTHAQVRGDRNCPTCRGTGVRDCSGSILYDNDGRVRSSSSATTPCYCAKATPAVPDEVKASPAVPDDVAETAKRLREATFTKGRMRGGVGGQTIEANMRSTFHEVSAWDLDIAADEISALRAENERLRADGLDWTTCGIVEIAARNPSVMEYMAHWEGRAEAAEAERDRLQAELARLNEALEEIHEVCIPQKNENRDYGKLVRGWVEDRARAALTQTERTGETDE